MPAPSKPWPLGIGIGTSSPKNFSCRNGLGFCSVCPPTSNLPIGRSLWLVFLCIRKTGNDPKNPGFRPPGIQGMSVNEISVRGVIEKLDGGYVAMIQGPDNKTYSIHTGDRLFDGLVRAVNAEGLVIVQEVNDPLSLVKQREVSKKLRSLEAKE